MNRSRHQPSDARSAHDRRGFFTRLFAGLVGCLAGLVPAGAGVWAFLDPLERKTGEIGFLRVASIDSLPDDGIARRFPVVADRTDSWNRYLNEPIGAVYLRRLEGGSEVQAFNAICPHAGCFVGFNIEQNEFQCPCHNSTFQPDGVRVSPEQSPSPRDLDRLRVDLPKLAQGEVWIEFKNFETGTATRRPR